MASRDKTTHRPIGRSHPKAVDAVTLLKQDHREVEEYFEAYEKTKNEKKKAELARQICNALTVHAQIEEEIFYPAARKATGDDDLLDEATVEHASAKQLIAEIQGMNVGAELFDARIKVLSEQIQHHVEEEEKELFPETKKTDLDLDTLGEQLAARKAELIDAM